MINTVHTNFIEAFKESARQNWDSIALTDYPYSSITYKELASIIKRFHSLWAQKGLRKGDKIGIFASNSTQWAVLYFSIVSGGYTAVLFPSTIPYNVIDQYIYHSDCRILYTDKSEVSSILSISCSIECIVICNSIYSILNPTGINGDSSTQSICNIDFHFGSIEDTDICTILYTSGSLGNPKGVMLNVAMISFIVINYAKELPYQCLNSHVNMLPFFHIFGLVVELIIPLCVGMNLVVIRDPSQSVIIESLKKFAPQIFFAVPFMIENFVNSIINKGTAHNYNEKTSLSLARQRLVELLGGNIKVIFTGGAPLSPELEKVIFEQLNLPVITAYGSSETGLVALGKVGNHVKGSTGQVMTKENVRIFSSFDGLFGEIQIKNINIFSGYYKDSMATKGAFTDDGWFKTGDLGYIDEEGNLFVTGRCKDMLLTSNGENVYPAEIEETMNAFPYVKESILVQRDEKLYAIVVPDREKVEADGLTAEALNKKIDEAVREASKKLPGFTIISGFELRDEPLERTPKGSLKRYLYSDGIKEN